MESQEKKEKHNVKKTAERFVLEKFDGRNTNAYEWISVFENECTRFNIQENEEKIKILRLFLEKSCIDWYSSMMMKLGLQSDWSTWKENFTGTYANKGWANSRYALSFKYQQGSLLDFAIKKEKLLLQGRKTIDQGTLTDIIAAGLPTYIIDRINKEEILETRDLFNELGKLEHLVSNKKFNKQNDNENKNVNTNKVKVKCSICEKLKKKVRYHPESQCYFKSEYEKLKDKNHIKLINNSELECELQDESSKN